MDLALITLENSLAAPRAELPRGSAQLRIEGGRAASKDAFRTALASADAGASNAETHRVVRGETLWGICRGALQDSGVSPTHAEVQAAVERVAAANHLRDPDRLSTGQALDLRAAAPLAEAEPAASDGLKAARVPLALRQLDGRPFPSSGVTSSVQENSAVAALDQGGPAPSGILVASRAGAAGEMPDSNREAVQSMDTVKKADEGVLPLTRADLLAMIERLLGETEAVENTASDEPGPWSSLIRDGSGRLTSSFGMRADPFTGLPEHHDGIDIAAPAGTDFYPVKAGQVVAAGWQPGYGRSVVLRHRDGTESVYGHASKLLVRPGELVTANDPIGEVGSTGRATGPHLHFEVRVQGVAVNPVPFLPQATLQLAQAK